MPDTVLSRSYLQGLPDRRKKQEMNAIFDTFLYSLERAASAGETSYFFNMTNMKQIPPMNSPYPFDSKKSFTIPVDELVIEFKIKFPDCYIKYLEKWVESTVNTRVLKRGILIDWS
jgi:hypothetical protein